MKDKSFIPALTGIRALCVYFIFFYHLNFFSPEKEPALHCIFDQFYTFLTFFFVLSGFVICHKYYGISSLKKKDLYNYFINRISRVFPILILLISITFLLGYRQGLYGSGANTVKLYLLNITLFKGFSSEYYLTGIGPSWSMSVEELFYTLSPLIFLYTKKVSSLIKFVLIFYGIGILLTFIFTQHPFEGFFSSYIFTGYTTFFGRIFEFACGIFLAMLVKEKYQSRLLKKIGARSLYIGLIIIVISIALLYSVAQHYQAFHAHDTWPGLAVNNLLMPV
ncbi:MAG: acyltransferase [Ferruginibacter sp.]